MKQDMTPQENAWRKSIKDHAFQPEASDWQAMERLLDQEGHAVGIAPAETLPPPGPGLPISWKNTLFTGLILGLIWILVYGYTGLDDAHTPLTTKAPLPAPSGPIAHEDDHANVIANNVADSQHNSSSHSEFSNRASGKTHMPLNPAGSSDKSGNQQQSDIENQSDIATEEISGRSILTDNQRVYKLAVPDINTLDESEYTPGLMAFSRLIRPIYTVPNPTTGISGTDALMLPKKPSRMHYGIVGGFQSAITSPSHLNGPILPHLGVFAQYQLAGHWRLQAELLGKWTEYEQIYASQEALDNFHADPSFVAPVSNASGLWFIEMPVTIGYHRGRYGLRAGVKAAWVNEMPKSGAADQNSGSPLIVSIESISTPPKSLDYGLTAGWSYLLSKRLELDIRYNHGLVNLISQQRSDPVTFRNSDVMLSARWYLQ